jgi:hypothetical protein
MCWICREITLHSHTFTQTTRSYAERVTCISSCTASSHLGRVMSPHTNDSARALCGRTRQEIESPVCPDPTYPHPGMSVRHHHTPPDRTPNPVNIAPPTKAVGVYDPAIPVPIGPLRELLRSELREVIHDRDQNQEWGGTCPVGTRPLGMWRRQHCVDR